MNIRRRLVVCGLLLSAPISASTGFHVRAPETSGNPSRLYAISTGWYYPVQAAVMVNPRNVRKTNASGSSFQWDAQWGSVTKTMIGLDMPMSGVNEKGLLFQATVLAGRPSVRGSSDSVMIPQLRWMQYHLDTSTTVAEVIRKSLTSKAPILPTGKYNIQFQACDAHDCAVFSFYDQTAVAQGSMGRVEVDFGTGTTKTDTKQTWPLAAIANHTYGESIDAFNKCQSFPCVGTEDSLNRFIKAAVLAKTEARERGPWDAVATKTLADLKAVDQGSPKTTWNVVYELVPRADGTNKITLFYKSPSTPIENRQWIDFGSPDFDCRKPIKVWWLDMAKKGGDQTGEASTFTQEAQQKLVGQHVTIYSLDEIKGFISYPETTKCLPPPSH
jgi:penicillin V acylase-like amidase (Ntn superfamily)